MSHRKLNEKGFTLVEIMIVVAIIGLLAAIAIPNLVRSRQNAQVGAMRSDVRAFSAAAESFRAAQATPAYPDDIAALTGATPPYLDASSWSEGGVRNGYTINYLTTGETYSLNATADDRDSICIDQTGVAVIAGTASDAGCAAAAEE
ncbi:MAG: prepilin-type N-terminal cleavage/methylation domain-containing protein [Candidatus Omnitrophica bacterium]|nr:prepilin-type N-terminal cleavage/methylation domain-containing protein [Candidatus Omnitrophota bacterium]